MAPLDECHEGVLRGHWTRSNRLQPGSTTVARSNDVGGNLPENRGKGVVKLDGRMVERMHADIARRVVAIADAIEASSLP